MSRLPPLPADVTRRGLRRTQAHATCQSEMELRPFPVPDTYALLYLFVRRGPIGSDEVR